MGSIPDKESSPATSLDEEIDLDEVEPTSIAKRAAAASQAAPRPHSSQLAATQPVSVQPPSSERPDSSPRMSSPVVDLPVIGHYSRFALLGRIAFGGMAEIFLARESSATGASRHLVIKRILPHVADDEGFVTMFLDEARLAIRLQHPNICPIYEFGEAAGTWFIAMEWVNGVPLGKLIRKARATGGVPIPVTVRVLAQISEALHYAHRARDENGQPLGIVHRDVSPQNIMISYSGSVKLLDFGVAKASSHSTKTQAGIVKGKLAYMAPEQCRGEEIDARADVFALGVCLFEALTGRPLYHRTTEFETLKAVMDDPVPSVRSFKPDIPADLDAIVQRALAKSVDDRWQSAGELQEALEQWLTDHREMMNAARTGAYLESLYAEEIARGPSVNATTLTQTVRRDSLPAVSASAPNARAAGVGPIAYTPQPFTPSPVASQAQVETGKVERRSRAPRKKSVLPVVLGVVVLLGIVLGVGGAFAAWAFTHDDVEQPIAATPPNTATGASLGQAPVPRDGLAEAPLVGAEPPNAYDYLPNGDDDPPVGALPPGVEAPPAAAGDPTPREPARPRAQGTLAINTRPWSKVYVGSRLLGTTPFGGVSVPAGNASLRLVDRDGNTHRRSVRVEAGREAAAFFDLSE